MRKDWDHLTLKNDTLAVFLVLPQGGGDKNIFQTLIGIALIAAAVFIPALAPYATPIIATGASLTIQGLGLFGVPEVPSTEQIGSASPTYSLSAQGNAARLRQAIPVIYGRHRVYPDFAETPYTEYVDVTTTENNETFTRTEQFLHTLLVIGQGEYDLHEVYIENTPVSNFQEITYQKVEPGDAITEFTNNVYRMPELASNILFYKEPPIGPFPLCPVGETINQFSIDIECPRGLFRADDDGDFQFYIVYLQIETREIDDDGEPVTGADWVKHGSRKTTIISFLSRRFIRSTLADPDDTDVFEQIASDSPTPWRYTFKYTIEPGRYEVRVNRIYPFNNRPAGVSVQDDEPPESGTNARISDETRWTAANGYLVGDLTYSGITMLAIKMQASNNLTNQSSRRINCEVTRKIPTWNPTTLWSGNTATKSIVWATVDALKSTVYGAGWADDKFDLQELYDLEQILTTRGDTFNGVFDRQMSMKEAVRLITRTGRSTGVLHGNIFRIVRDRLQTIPVAMFSPRNITKNSFSISYSLYSDETVDGVTLEYVDPKTWKPAEVSIDVDGGEPDNPAKLRLFGCTDADQAEREALYIARNNLYRRKEIIIVTELEGYIPTFGDLVVISHDMPEWGISGDVMKVEQDGSIRLTEPVELSDDTKTYNIAFRTRDGGVSGPWAVTAGTVSNSVLLSGTWTYIRDPGPEPCATATNSSGDSIRLYCGTEEERTQFSFGEANAWSQRCIVKGIKPRGDYQIQLALVIEDNRVHAD